MKWENHEPNYTFLDGQNSENQSNSFSITSSTSEQTTLDLVPHTTSAPFPEDPNRTDPIVTEEQIPNDENEQPKSNTKKGKGEINSYLFKCKQFNGEIVAVDDVAKTFTATLKGADAILREATFSFDDVEKDDEALISQNAQIIFIYGKQYTNGTVYNFSKIYFRSKLRWTQAQIRKAQQNAEELMELLKKKNEIPND